MRTRLVRSAIWLACLLGVAAASWGGEPERPVRVLAGVTYSRGLGELAWAPYAEARLDRGPWRLSAQGELSRKVESGQGFRVGADADYQAGPVVLTAAYRYRDGGAWRKGSAWAGAGVGGRDARLVVRKEIAGQNDTTSATLTLARGPLEWQGAVYRYRPTFGGAHRVGSTLLLALRY